MSPTEVTEYIRQSTCQNLGAAMAIQKVPEIKGFMNDNNLFMDCNEANEGLISIGNLFETEPYKYSFFINLIELSLKSSDFSPILTRCKRQILIAKVDNLKNSNQQINTAHETALYLNFGPAIDDLLKELKSITKDHLYGIVINPVFPGNDQRESTIKQGFVYSTLMQEESFIKTARTIKFVALKHGYTNFYVEQETKFSETKSKLYVLPSKGKLDISAI